ncbi:MAG: hypothetical protein IJT87_07835 [Ruminiclostridium sp.]|nr:hypothetical protein [Ruminiclostridium sp.]
MLTQEQKKLEASEATTHERQSGLSDKRKMQGYEQHPRDDRSYEVFGLGNSFDDISVGADRKGSMTVAVSSRKSYKAETLSSEKKRLRGTRRRIKYEHFGQFYTNAYSDRDGAFAYKTSKNLPESRILREFIGNAKKYVSEEERSAAPFIDLDEDIAKLSEMRSESGSSNEGLSERQALERTIERKTQLRSRFVRKLRIARRHTYPGGATVDEGYDLLSALLPEEDTGEPPDDDENDDENDDVDDILDDIDDPDDE